MARKTSVSDNGAFPEFCYMASKHDEIFQSFRMHPIYGQIISSDIHPFAIDITLEYLKIVLSNPDFKVTDEAREKILRHDSLGNPAKISFKINNPYATNNERMLTCSTAYPRYLKVAFDVFFLFNTKKFKTVSEIGVGYAGQCNVLMNLFPITQYNLIDLPEVLALAERCLTEVNQTDGVRFIDGTHLYHDVPADFFISSFAFSELIRSVQDVYLEKVILKSKAGYITWNDGIDEKVWDTDGYSLKEILSIIPGAAAVIIPPQTYQATQKVCQKVCVILWGTK